MQLEKSPRRRDGFSVALETNTEAFDVSAGFGWLRRAWVRMRDTSDGPIIVQLSRKSLERTVDALQVRAAAMGDRLKAKPEDQQPEYIDMEGNPMEEIVANNNRRTIPNFMKSGLQTAARFMIDRADQLDRSSSEEV